MILAMTQIISFSTLDTVHKYVGEIQINFKVLLQHKIEHQKYNLKKTCKDLTLFYKINYNIKHSITFKNEKKTNADLMSLIDHYYSGMRLRRVKLKRTTKIEPLCQIFLVLFRSDH